MVWMSYHASKDFIFINGPNASSRSTKTSKLQDNFASLLLLTFIQHCFFFVFLTGHWLITEEKAGYLLLANSQANLNVHVNAGSGTPPLLIFIYLYI